MPKSKKTNKTTPATAGVSTGEFYTCQCCDPTQNLFPRLDLGGPTEDGEHSKIALCIFHKPAQVYVWNETEEVYERNEGLKFENNTITDSSGHQPFHVDRGVPSLVDLDVDDEASPEPPPPHNTSGGSEPASREHVNLENDGYY